jgi:replicative DNA helicase
MSETELNAIKKIAVDDWDGMTKQELVSISPRTNSLMGYDGPDRVYTNVDYWMEQDGKKDKIVQTYESKIFSLDAYTGGFQVGEVWVISGPSKHGKTTLCESMSHNFTQQGAKVLWFAFESANQFMVRQKDSGDIIYVPREKKPNNMTWIEDRVLEAKLKFNCNVVFLDHLHYLAPFDKLLKNPSVTIGALMRTLVSEIAAKYEILVILVAHVTKLDFTEEPNENDIRDSSFVTQEAHGTIMVYRRLKEGKRWGDQDPFDSKSKLIVCNARRTGAMRGKVNLEKKGNYLVEEVYE